MSQEQNLTRLELSTLDVARELGPSPPTVRNLTERGELTGWRFGKVYRYSRAAVEQFKNRQLVRPQQAA